MASVEAIAKPELLRWARESAGLSLEDAARKLQTKAEKLLRWETGQEPTTLAKLRKMAQVYKRQFSDFFLPEPPAEETIPHDFRRMPGEVALTYSPQLRHQLRMAHTRRAILRDLLDELDEVIPAFGLQTTLNSDPEAVGQQIREFFNIPMDVQRSWARDAGQSARRAYKNWRSAIESHGILVFQFVGVSTRESLGFSLAFEMLPVVAVNQKSHPNSRTFSLFHELTHLMLSRSGLCDFEEELQPSKDDQAVERFCNHVAGATLVPAEAIVADPVLASHRLGVPEWSDQELEALSRTYSVSEEVVLRRLLILGRTTPRFYQRKRAEFIERYARLEQERRKSQEDKEIKRNMPREALSNLGRNYTYLVLESFHQDQITLADASRFLSLRPEQVQKLEQIILAE